VREDLKRGVFIEGIMEETISCSEEAIDILKKGARNRHVGATNMNSESSRSHSVFTMTIESKQVIDGVTNMKTSKFHFVDLAGSERQKQTSSVGTRLKEAGNINKSLTVLGSVINSLVDVAQGKKTHIRYRDSKLTFLLKDSLGGNSKTTMIANISPASINFSETLSTLKFAQRAKLIKNNASINEESTGSIEVLKREITRLKRELDAYKIAPPSELNPRLVEHKRGQSHPQTSSISQEALEEQQKVLLEHNKNQIELEQLLQEAMGMLEASETKAKSIEEKAQKMRTISRKASAVSENKEMQMRMMLNLYEEKLRRISFSNWGEEDERDSVVRQNVGLDSWQRYLNEVVKDTPVVMQVFQQNLELTCQLEDLETARRLSSNGLPASSSQESGQILAVLKDINEKMQVADKTNRRTASLRGEYSRLSSKACACGEQ
jgi:kinesin family protein 15